MRRFLFKPALPPLCRGRDSGRVQATTPSTRRAPEPCWHLRKRTLRSNFRKALWSCPLPSAAVLACGQVLLDRHHGNSMPAHCEAYVVCQRCPQSWIYEYKRAAKPNCEECGKRWPAAFSARGQQGKSGQASRRPSRQVAVDVELVHDDPPGDLGDGEAGDADASADPPFVPPIYDDFPHLKELCATSIGYHNLQQGMASLLGVARWSAAGRTADYAVA